MSIIAHTMQYTGERLPLSEDGLRKYRDSDYTAYQTAYNRCFAPMRRALNLQPVYCCGSRDTLLNKAENIFIFEVDGELVGSVAIYGHEIDDLIVAEKFQRKGYGQRLLRFAVARMQQDSVTPITLHVADWNQTAMRLYLKNGFSVIETETL